MGVILTTCKSWDDPPRTLGRHIALKGFLANSYPSPCPLSRSLPHSRWRERPGSFTLQKAQKMQRCWNRLAPHPSLLSMVYTSHPGYVRVYIFTYTFTHVYKYISFHLCERKKARGFPISDHLFLRFHIGAKGDVDLGSLSWH